MSIPKQRIAKEMEIKLARVRENKDRMEGESFRVPLPINKTFLLVQLAEEVFVKEADILSHEEGEEALVEIIQRLDCLLDMISPEGKFFGCHPSYHEGYLPFGNWSHMTEDHVYQDARPIPFVSEEKQSANA